MRFGNLSTSRVWVMAVLLAGLGGCGGGGGGSHGAGAASASVKPVGAVSQAPLRIGLRGWYVTQAVQKLDGSVPLVAGRDGVLRVFLTANTANQAMPTVRVTVTGAPGGPWQRTIPAPGTSVPLALDENHLGASWNLAIPGAGPGSPGPPGSGRCPRWPGSRCGWMSRCAPPPISTTTTASITTGRSCWTTSRFHSPTDPPASGGADGVGPGTAAHSGKDRTDRLLDPEPAGFSGPDGPWGLPCRAGPRLDRW